MTLHDRRSRGQRGAVAVEFAIIMVPLFLMLIGAIEFGRVYSQLQVYQGGAREYARCLAVQASDAPCDPYTNLVAHLGGYPAPPPGSITVTVTPGGGTTCTASTRGSAVRASWMQNFNLNIPFWSSATITREIVGVFRCE